MRMNKNWDTFDTDDKIASFFRKYKRGSISIAQLQNALELLNQNQDPLIYPKEKSTKDDEIGYWDETEGELVSIAYDVYKGKFEHEGPTGGDLDQLIENIDDIADSRNQEEGIGGDRVSRESLTGE
jgi:hypothetical protein